VPAIANRPRGGELEGSPVLKIRPVRVVFFDAAETLFRTRGSVGNIYLSLARKYGSKASANQLDGAFFDVFKKQPPPVLPAGTSSDVKLQIEKAWWRDVVHQVFSSAGMMKDFDAYFEEVYDVFKGSQGWELFPESLDVLSRLKEKGYRTGLITNFDTRVLDVLRALGIDRYLDSKTLSSEAGAAKPDPAIFKKAVESLGVLPSEAVHVGDSMSDDVRGALSSGLQAVLLDRHRLFKPSKNFVTIESLTELLDYLE